MESLEYFIQKICFNNGIDLAVFLSIIVLISHI
jgi:hypothetical protein